MKTDVLGVFKAGWKRLLSSTAFKNWMISKLMIHAQ